MIYCNKCGEVMVESPTQCHEGYDVVCPECGNSEHIYCNQEAHNDR